MLHRDHGANLDAHTTIAGSNLGSIEIDAKRVLHGRELDNSRISQHRTVVRDKENAAGIGWNCAQAGEAHMNGLPWREPNGLELIAGVVEAALQSSLSGLGV